jgi:hypothetical protein
VSGDPAADVVAIVEQAMREWFNPQADPPPTGGGSTVVRVLATDANGVPFDPEGDCKGPFLWVRVDRRYRSHLREFPAVFVKDIEPCCRDVDVVRALPVEVGVARCVSMAETPNPDTIEDESETALDDSWRIEQVMALSMARLREDYEDPRAIALDTVAILGPAGGQISVQGVIYVQL